MKKDICFILLFLFVTASSAFAQLIGFESSEAGFLSNICKAIRRTKIL